jgi:hypothetical protein
MFRTELQGLKKSTKRTEPPPNSIQAVAREEGFSVSFLYKQIAEGKLVARKAGARTIITREARAMWLESMPKISPRRPRLEPHWTDTGNLTPHFAMPQLGVGSMALNFPRLNVPFSSSASNIALAMATSCVWIG